MILRRFTFTLLCITLISCFSSCSNDDEDNETEQTVEENDWMLNGAWKLKQNSGDEDFNASDIVFRTDGTGIMDDEEFKWYTHSSELYIRLNKGSSIQSSYYVQGATLTIEKIGVYITQLPVTGTWYAADAMSEFIGGTFCYYFNENGDGIKYTFDYIGLTAKTKFTWQKSPKGINVIYTNASEEKECSFSDDVMTINGEGRFTSALPFYGKWKAVDCEKGLIYEDDDNFSTLDITARENRNTFICRYKTMTENDFKETVFQGDLKFVSSHQMFFDDQQLFLIKDLTGSTDTKALEYRFFFFPPRKKVYLDLSHELKSKRFVRYELISK